MGKQPEGDVDSKKKVRRTERSMNTAIFELRMAELGIWNPDDFTIGMVYDILTEKSNDNEKYIQLADQSDIDAFLGR